MAVCYAVGPIILSRWLSDLPPFGVISLSLAAAAICYAPFAAFSIPATRPSWNVIASVLTLAVVCTALAFVLFFELIEQVGPLRATVITYVNPAVAAILGVAILGRVVHGRDGDRIRPRAGRVGARDQACGARRFPGTRDGARRRVDLTNRVIPPSGDPGLGWSA